MELTVLMPCLNEAATVGTCVAKARGFLERAGITGEVLVADNGSNDGSRELARAAGARVVEAPQRGYGAALAAGIAAARGRYVIMGDADDSYDFSRLEVFVEKLRAGHPLVMGNRFKGGIREGAMPWLHRYLGNPVLSFIGRLLFRTGVRDFHCGLRGFDREAVRRLDLRTAGMEFASELVVKASLAGWRIAEVPTTLQPDAHRRIVLFAAAHRPRGAGHPQHAVRVGCCDAWVAALSIRLVCACFGAECRPVAASASA
jgi:glycosyltransferase involved in cell wall biosynthesis